MGVLHSSACVHIDIKINSSIFTRRSVLVPHPSAPLRRVGQLPFWVIYIEYLISTCKISQLMKSSPDIHQESIMLILCKKIQ